jgi:hypothetical protein
MVVADVLFSFFCRFRGAGRATGASGSSGKTELWSTGARWVGSVSSATGVKSGKQSLCQWFN